MGKQRAEWENLRDKVHKCTLCSPFLPEGVRPILQLHTHARILIAGQAPGRKVHFSGIPFADASGNRLREWLGVEPDTFYDAKKFAILPMGFCYPGSGKNGDLPPRPECAATWRQKLMAILPDIELTVLLGQHAMSYHLPHLPSKMTLTEVVHSWRSYSPSLMPLPHPSPRNNIWLRRNLWFEKELLPHLRSRVAQILSVHN